MTFPSKAKAKRYEYVSEMMKMVLIFLLSPELISGAIPNGLSSHLSCRTFGYNLLSQHKTIFTSIPTMTRL